ncbi:RAMP superfamily CRISPR-associated protein [Defluviitalea phaphyphila]|uniref:RAMP superfamily CRISPR-associated protein n=1 Tax=Defluviitalea phaphyphila TaxID=1473580 RepID=UPI0007317686|nr:RAMP superfamily CRISPR-associated protein [Defluviitalea phaphyphila]
MSFSPSMDKYFLEIEILSPTCIEGVDNLGGSDSTKYHSYEYIIDDDAIYFIKEEDILNLLNIGILKEEDLDKKYDELLEKIKNMKEAKKYLEIIKLKNKLENKIELSRFSKSVIIDDNHVKQVPTIFGSTVKGMLRTGFIAAKDINMQYYFKRRGKNLVLQYNMENKSKNKENRQKNQQKQLERKLTNIKDYNVKIKDKNYQGSDIIELIFKNIVCCDLKLYEGEMIVEKIDRIDRRKKTKRNANKGIPQYFETPNIGSIFKGEIYYKYYDKNRKAITLFQCLNKQNDYITPVEEAFAGLKKMANKIIKVERRMLKDTKSQDTNTVENFYDMLLEKNNEENQFVFKLGHSGILSKSFMVFDNKNINNNDFIPYTINVSASSGIPTGWVRIKWDIE